jgi:hypothetical protein
LVFLLAVLVALSSGPAPKRFDFRGGETGLYDQGAVVAVVRPGPVLRARTAGEKIPISSGAATFLPLGFVSDSKSAGYARTYHRLPDQVVEIERTGENHQRAPPHRA